MVTADFSQDASQTSPDISIVDIDSGDIMLQFVAYSSSEGLLFFSGPSKSAGSLQATVGILCPVHGKVHAVIAVLDNILAVGPLVADDVTGRVLFFMKLSAEPTKWTLFSVDYTENSEVVPLRTYEGEDYATFAAAGYMA